MRDREEWHFDADERVREAEGVRSVSETRDRPRRDEDGDGE